jgi:hypothetical protein
MNIKQLTIITSTILLVGCSSTTKPTRSFLPPVEQEPKEGIVTKDELMDNVELSMTEDEGDEDSDFVIEFEIEDDLGNKDEFNMDLSDVFNKDTTIDWTLLTENAEQEDYILTVTDVDGGKTFVQTISYDSESGKKNIEGLGIQYQSLLDVLSDLEMFDYGLEFEGPINTECAKSSCQKYIANTGSQDYEIFFDDKGRLVAYNFELEIGNSSSLNSRLEVLVSYTSVNL